MLAVSAAMHADAWLHSPAFQSGLYTASLAFAAMGGEHAYASDGGGGDSAAAAVAGATFAAVRRWVRLALYAAAWLAFRRLFVAVERARGGRGGTATTRYLLIGMRWYVLGSFLLRPRLRAILHAAGSTPMEGLQNAWIFEEVVLNGPVLVYGIVLLQFVSLDRTMALELEAQVSLARKRQAVAEALAKGKTTFLSFVFHEVGPRFFIRCIRYTRDDVYSIAIEPRCSCCMRRRERQSLSGGCTGTFHHFSKPHQTRTPPFHTRAPARAPARRCACP